MIADGRVMLDGLLCVIWADGGSGRMVALGGWWPEARGVARTLAPRQGRTRGGLDAAGASTPLSPPLRPVSALHV